MTNKVVVTPPVMFMDYEEGKAIIDLLDKCKSRMFHRIVVSITISE